MTRGHHIAKCLHCLKEWTVGDCVPLICQECEDAGHTGLSIDCPLCFPPAEQIAHLRRILEAAEAENARLRAALAVFADPENWVPTVSGESYQWNGEEKMPDEFARRELEGKP